MTQLSIIKEKGMLHLNGFTADHIVNLLAEKHVKDVFVPECKNGETWGARDLLKLDAWVLARTYSPLTTIGYEVKVDRQDFEQDQKWVGYLDLCHVFYFVCPAGLVRSHELPKRVGLIWVSQTGKLHTKKKPEREQPDIEKLNRLLIYIVMARSKIVANMYAHNNEIDEDGDKLKRLRSTVEGANQRNELAYFVKGHIRSAKTKLVEEQKQLKYREDSIKLFEKQLALLGITWDSTVNTWQDNSRVEQDINLLKQRLDTYTVNQLRDIGRRMVGVAETIAKYHETNKEGTT